MNKRGFPIRIFIPWLFMTALACTVTGRLLPQTPKETAPALSPTTESTRTETAPQIPSVTRRPSSTPAPPCVPPLGSDAMRTVQEEADTLVPGATVTWYDDFNCSDLSYGWGVGYLNPNTKVTVIDGVLTFSTREENDVYDGIGRTESNIQDRTGILILFRFSDGAAANLFIHTGTWQTQNFRRWGMQFHYDPQLFPTWNYWKGINGMGEYFPEYVMRPDAWFYLMIRLGESGDITMKVWEKDQPENHTDFRRSVDSTWAGRRWWALFQVVNGTLELDRYWEAAFVGEK